MGGNGPNSNRIPGASGANYYAQQAQQALNQIKKHGSYYLGQAALYGQSWIHYVGDLVVTNSDRSEAWYPMWFVDTVIAYSAYYTTNVGYTFLLFRHYLNDWGQPYTIDPVPQSWQTVIKKHCGKLPDGTHKNIKSYNWGNFELRNSLGTLELEISTNPDGTRTYKIRDHYHFPYTVPKQGVVEHGFGIPAQLPQIINPIMPLTTFPHPNMSTGQTFEAKKIAGNWFFVLPTAWLDKNGVPFDIDGQFTI